MNKLAWLWDRFKVRIIITTILIIAQCVGSIDWNWIWILSPIWAVELIHLVFNLWDFALYLMYLTLDKLTPDKEIGPYSIRRKK